MKLFYVLLTCLGLGVCSQMTAAPSQQIVNLNHADAKSLVTLKGIGRKSAKAILAYRKQHGVIHSPVELARVPGFSAKRVSRLLKNNAGHLQFMRARNK